MKRVFCALADVLGMRLECTSLNMSDYNSVSEYHEDFEKIGSTGQTAAFDSM